MYTQNKFTRFERARIIGSRALQVSMGAPVLIDLPEKMENPIEIAILEFKERAVPMTVIRNIPGKDSLTVDIENVDLETILY